MGKFPEADFLADNAVSLGLPVDIVHRGRPKDLKAVNGLLQLSDHQVQNERRSFHLGLMIAFLAVVEEMCQRSGAESLPDALGLYPPLEERGGRRLNTLSLPCPRGGSPVGLRSFYNKIERTIRFTLGRRGYPSMAPHATQAWQQHRDELEALFRLMPEERAALAQGLWSRVLALPKPAYRTHESAQIRPLPRLLKDFTSAPGEPPGVTLQSLVYGYFNVEMAHLTAIESDKVRAGGARSGNVGDIDGWDASELVLAVEVKDLDLTVDNQDELHGFLSNLVDWPNCTAIVVANSFSEEVMAFLSEQNVLALSRADMIERTQSWDLEKQRKAVRAIEYYIVRVQAHPGFSARYARFVAESGLTLD